MNTFTGSVDTNVLLRLLLDDIPEQRNAVIELFDNATTSFSVADTAIIEVVFVLERHYKFTRQEVFEAVDGLMSLSEINCNRTLFEKALPLFMKHSSLSFEDCCLSIYAELNDATPLWTFDQKLSKQVSFAKLIEI